MALPKFACHFPFTLQAGSGVLAEHAEHPNSEQTKRACWKRESAKSHESLPSVSETMELDITEEERGLSLTACQLWNGSVFFARGYSKPVVSFLQRPKNDC